MDDSLRNALWNWIYSVFEAGSVKRQATGVADYWRYAARYGMWDEFFHYQVDDIPSDTKKAVKAYFTMAEWWEAYNFVECVLQNLSRLRPYDDRISGAESERRLNTLLEREVSGYRAIEERLVPVTSTVEIEEIRRASSPTAGFEGIATHINAALALLSRKPEPDYRNSIKESISAVEAAAKLLTGEKSGGIDKALGILEGKHPLHKAFKDALSKLYGYTSDQDGIRHPILAEEVITAAEARFMLVACSAFANFLLDLGKDATA